MLLDFAKKTLEMNAKNKKVRKNATRSKPNSPGHSTWRSVL
jgi:hypothetical protein